MKRVYDSLLRLYPRDYRALFGVEMRAAFEAAEKERTSAPVTFYFYELTGLLLGILTEWTAKLTTDTSIRGRTLPDRLLMRPPGVSWQSHYGGAGPRPAQ